MKNLTLTSEFVLNGRFVDGVEMVEAIATDGENNYIVITPILDSSAEMDSSDFADYDNYIVWTKID